MTYLNLSAEKKKNCKAFADRFCIPFDSIENCVILPGLVDVHVHLREPGFSYKETIATGTLAAAKGGYCAVCSMPNLNPVPDNEDNIRLQLSIINENARIRVFPYASITVGEKGEELVDMKGLSPYAIAFSDDCKGVQRTEMMLNAMENANKLGVIIAAHCEDDSLLNGGYIHDGQYAKKNGHRGICSESEWKQIERDIELARKTGCKYHVCHISTKESVELIRRAKASGVDITCETAPHYLVFDDTNMRNEGRFKMNPPLRSQADKAALIEGICDGTIDMIATDHAPHSAEEKARGLEKSAFGVVGLETAFAAVYTFLVKPGIISLEKLVELMSVNPAKRFKIDTTDCFAAFDISTPYTVDSGKFASMGHATPFDGMELYGKCVINATGNQIIWKDNEFFG